MDGQFPNPEENHLAHFMLLIAQQQEIALNPSRLLNLNPSDPGPKMPETAMKKKEEEPKNKDNDVKDEKSEEEKTRIEKQTKRLLEEMTAGMPRPSVTHAFSCHEMLLMAISNYAKNIDQKEMEKMMTEGEMKAMTRAPEDEDKKKEGDGA